MAEDAFEYATKLPDSRLKRRLKRLERLTNDPLPTKARPGTRGAVTMRHGRRRKKGGLDAP